jgi:hypothetical protein
MYSRRFHLGFPPRSTKPSAAGRKSSNVAMLASSAGWSATTLRKRRQEDVTTARRILPGTTYMITRRCTERMFLRGADDRSAEAFCYCRAEAAARCGVLVHAAVVMSNHLHLIVTL